LTFSNSVAFNVIVGIAIGAVLGFLATLSKAQAE
jgi:gas vesicle protein